MLIVIALSLPLFRKNMFLGDDYEYHAARIQSISDSLKNGVFPVKVHSQMANGYGYASRNFLSKFIFIFACYSFTLWI